jgi:hypothetical protein
MYGFGTEILKQLFGIQILNVCELLSPPLFWKLSVFCACLQSLVQPDFIELP